MDFRQQIFSGFSFLFFLFSQNSFAQVPNPAGNVVDLLEEKSFLAQQDFKNLGDHIIAEFTGCMNLNQSEELKTILRDAAEAAGATVLSVTVHQFEPFGMTGVAVLQESHISVHTWPEYGYASLDIYTCGDHVQIENALEVMKKFFEPKKVRVVSLQRGFEEKEYLPEQIKKEFRLPVL